MSEKEPLMDIRWIMSVIPHRYPLLLVDRVLEITAKKSRGTIVAERDVNLDDWFFQCHFQSDPVQPGCLGVDAIWQMLGLYCALRGGQG